MVKKCMACQQMQVGMCKCLVWFKAIGTHGFGARLCRAPGYQGKRGHAVPLPNSAIFHLLILVHKNKPNSGIFHFLVPVCIVN